MQYFERYKPLIESYRKGDAIDAFLMEDFGAQKVFYAPFDYVNPNAKVLIVGITPGATQMENMLCEAKRLIAQGLSDELVLQRCKHVGSFSGGMRTNLVAMLDHVGLNRQIGIDSCEQLFGERADLANLTSCIRYPTFDVKNGKLSNFNADITARKHQKLFDFAAPLTLEELNTAEEAWIVPLGPVVEKYLKRILMGQTALERLLPALPHPSAANNERIAYFLGKKPKDQLSAKTNSDLLDEVLRQYANAFSR